MYVSVDAAGRVRETYPLNSDNAGLEDPARRQVEKWQFKPIIINDVPAQVDSVFTFAFNTSVSDSLPFLSNEEARRLAIQTVDPRIPPGLAPSGGAFRIRISVDKSGKVIGAKKVGDTSDALFLAGYAAVVRWRFRPYVHDGKPDAFNTEIVFDVP